MTRPSRFEIMRRNRKRKPAPLVLIDAIESEIDREWAEVRRQALAERRELFDDTADWLRDTKRQAHPYKTARRRWWQLWIPRANVAAP